MISREQEIASDSQDIYKSEKKVLFLYNSDNEVFPLFHIVFSPLYSNGDSPATFLIASRNARIFEYLTSYIKRK